VKVMALDYGRARTGVAVSDATGAVARPLGVVEYVNEEDGFAKLLDVIRIEQPDRIVVGLPLTLRGERGEQARETELFVQTLRDVIETPVELYDERFTTRLAEGGGAAEEDARAAAHLLSSYLEWANRGT
jgi:putative Holliday junction resolvase